MALRPNAGHDLLIHEVSRSHTTTHHRLVGLLWTSDRLIAETSTCTTHNTHNGQTSMPPVGFEPTISASEWPQTYALDRAATGAANNNNNNNNNNNYYYYYYYYYFIVIMFLGRGVTHVNIFSVIYLTLIIPAGRGS